MKNKHPLNGIYRGKVNPCYGFQTAINKTPITGQVYLSLEGLDGDECADMRHHGGLERALHQYPLEHYAYWRDKYGEDIDWVAPGMGENISAEGMTEHNVCLGDRYQWGEAIIEVSQPRSPCFKLNKSWGIEGFSVDMQEISRCGWLYRVIQPGMVSVTEPLELIAQEPNAMTLHETCDIFFGDPLDKDRLLTLKQQRKLSNSWMSKVNARLESNDIERWDFRLLGRTKSE
ncbi:MOSC domain-containing protein [Enterovibrio nigricans]|uniref:MOSC domain-containing protein YiiM n=1 Tax=Enterovibrio nigricans DSM 22720 TaxID=1121868 RepID=A0A1T4VYN2_9GAMM|nr:MOSC domain-containing protein [Enterovibrio nigricans]PKF49202.1 MOSC domain-containing protein [Enterovibrio nigricans]SKA70120.1 MOSC domain-containing protein YiiM [Enterovibrio nigricans DSM 22720]